MRRKKKVPRTELPLLQLISVAGVPVRITLLLHPLQ
jgi:hypothetical protein